LFTLACFDDLAIACVWFSSAS